MRATILLVMCMILLAIPISAEVNVFGQNHLVPSDKTWIQYSSAFYDYDINRDRNFVEGLIGTPIIFLEVFYACSDKETFNSLNPSNVITETPKLTIKYTHHNYVSGVSVNDSQDIIEFSADDNPTGIGNSSTVSFNLAEGEYIDFTVPTVFNTSSGLVQDSICTYELRFNSINCNSCGDTTFQEVTKQLDARNETFTDVNTAFTLMNTFVDLNFEIWVVLGWIFQITALIASIFLIFYAIFWFYLWIKRFVKSVGGGN